MHIKRVSSVIMLVCIMLPIREQFEHNANFAFPHAQFHKREIGREHRKPGGAKLHLNTQNAPSTHLKHPSATLFPHRCHEQHSSTPNVTMFCHVSDNSLPSQ